MILLFYFIDLSHCISISLPVTEINGVPTIKLYVGSPLQCVPSSLYFSTCTSYVASKSISYKYSNLYRLYNELYSETHAYYYDLLKMEVKGIIGKDIITLNLETIGTISFYYATSLNTVPDFEGILGLCYHPLSSDYSLLNQIKAQRRKRSFMLLSVIQYSM